MFDLFQNAFLEIPQKRFSRSLVCHARWNVKNCNSCFSLKRKLFSKGENKHRMIFFQISCSYKLSQFWNLNSHMMDNTNLQWQKGLGSRRASVLYRTTDHRLYFFTGIAAVLIFFWTLADSGSSIFCKHLREAPSQCHPAVTVSIYFHFHVIRLFRNSHVQTLHVAQLHYHLFQCLQSTDSKELWQLKLEHTERF